MEFSCLGTLEARVDGVPVELGEPQRRLVLAMLMTHADTVVSTDRLVDGIWGYEPPTSSRKIVQGYVSGLRKAFGNAEVIESQSPGYRLNAKPEQIDAHRFEELAAEGASEVTSDPDRARELLGGALALWRGAPYEDLGDCDALHAEISRLEQLRLTAIENRMAAEIYAGNAPAVVDELADLTRRHGLRERMWALRLLVLYRMGRRTEALRAFDEARTYLGSEVGLEPSAQLVIVRDRIIQQDSILETNAALDLVVPEPAATRNPYKGLRAFDEADAADFFGRDDLVRRLHESLDRRSTPRLVLLTGASGTGKSSVVRAGLIPRLRREGWHITSMYPGTDPNDALRVAIGSLGEADRGVIVIDQLEELFTLVDDPAVHAAFLEALVDVADPRRGGPWVIATIRADFLRDCMEHRGMAGLLGEALVIVTPLDDHQVRDVITKPAARVGCAVDPELVATMAQQVARRPTALPLLEFALADLFDRADGGVLTADDYHAGGGIAGPLIQRAEGLYDGFDDVRRETTKQLMLRLVVLRDDGEPLRRRVPVASLGGLEGVDDVSETLGRHRLVTFDRGDDGEPTLEIAHEALLREWPRLRSWIDEAAVALRNHAQLAGAAYEWEASGRADAYLLTGARLARLSDWEDTGIHLTGSETAFLDVSIDREAEVETGRRRRRRWIMVGFAFAAIVATALAIYGARNAGLADERAREARAGALAASARGMFDEDPELAVMLGIEAIELDSDSDPAVAALSVALQEHRTVYAVDRSEAPPALGSISPDGELLAVVAGPAATLDVFEVGADEPLWSVEAREGEILDLAGFTTDGGQILVFEQRPGPNPDAPEATWTLRDAHTGQVDRLVSVDDACLFPYLWGGHPSGGFVDLDQPVWMVRNEACGWPIGSSATLVAFDLGSGEAEDLTEFRFDIVGGPTLSADGTRMAIASGGGGGVFMLDEDEPLLELPPGMSTLSSDGSLVLAGNDPMLLMDVANGETVAVFPGNHSRAAFSPSGRFVVAAGFDGATRVFDTFGGQELLELRGSGARDLVFQMTGDEQRLATFAPDGARVWDVGSKLFGTASPTVYGAEDGAFIVAAGIGVTSNRLVMPIGRDGSRETAIYQLGEATPIRTLPGRAVAISPDGSMLAMQSWPGEAVVDLESGGTGTYHQVGGLVLVDMESGEVVRELSDGPCVWYNRSDGELAGPGCGDDPEPWVEWAWNGSFSPDGSLFAMGGESGYVAVWDAATGERVHFVDSLAGGSQTLSGRDGFSVVAFSPSGDHLAVERFDLSPDTSVTVERVNTTTWETEADLELDQPLTAMRYTPDGSALVGGGSSADVTIIDAQVWDVAAELEGQQGGQLQDVDVSPDGRLVVAAAQNGVVWVWDVESESVVHRMDFPATGPAGGVVNVEFVDDQTILVSGESSAVLMTLDPETLLEVARTRVTREFTGQECTTYRLDSCAR